ncbi:UDP-2,4-diacetamido-2,4,6-trideoxy-beta-L-altropyranose hydrolase [Salinimicrobium marinum]|uniref:UDP-2,4-diacetamido-2,4, 6-trideoxy-beta-L-altropyranose hydrolase n=1 Tax=Salinimicrobium marinum TaxID=680283 RepID=A0A918S9D1_9FLAO|nr:hypothetical protein [Salinimicrobium marinum]GHA30242.1 UDP-2,4-diacetamido-2,4,6-trideoxy-beta-L-altropyranose hydrolase [Salinimicrobium marinum]
MKVFFLTEYSKSVGFGHLSRCSSLADAFQEKGYEVEFLIREWKDEALNLDYPKKKVEWQNTEEIRRLVSKEDLIVFDSYRVPVETLDKIAAEFPYVLSIADSKLNFSNNGVVILGSVYGKEMDFSSSGKNKLDFLAGPEYMLFRKIFWNIEKKKLQNTIETVLISLGGHANSEVLERVIATLSLYLNNAVIKILGNADIQVPDRVERLGFLNPLDLLEEYKAADLIITNGGQSLNEVILLGIPAIGISLVDNQNKNIQTWNERGILKNNINVGSEDFPKELEDAIIEIKDLSKRIERTARGTDMVDYKGALRVVEYIKKKCANA